MSEATRALLRSELRGMDGMIPFASAVVAQLARGAGAGAESGIGRRVAAMVRASTAGPLEVAAEALRSDPPLFAAFFQNLDLLFDAPPAESDAVSGLVMAALEGVTE
jgi:hypothetical protein